jgi:hypothetical protein
MTGCEARSSRSRAAKVAYVVVGATGMVVIASLVEAGCWVVFHDGFGMGDLLPWHSGVSPWARSLARRVSSCEALSAQ